MDAIKNELIARGFVPVGLNWSEMIKKLKEIVGNNKYFKPITGSEKFKVEN